MENPGFPNSPIPPPRHMSRESLFENPRSLFQGVPSGFNLALVTSWKQCANQFLQESAWRLDWVAWCVTLAAQVVQERAEQVRKIFAHMESEGAAFSARSGKKKERKRHTRAFLSACCVRAALRNLRKLTVRPCSSPLGPNLRTPDAIWHGWKNPLLSMPNQHTSL